MLILRLTPGIPLFLQNYVLGFLRVPFFIYVPVSIVCTGVFTCGIVLAGAGISTGSWTAIWTGVGVVVVGMVMTQAIRAGLRRRRSSKGPSMG